MTLPREYLTQTLYQEGFTPSEVLDRLQALDTGVPRTMVHSDFYIARLAATDFIEKLNNMGLGVLLYSELIPTMNDAGMVRGLNLTFRKEGGDITYVTLADETQVSIHLHRPDPVVALREFRMIAAAFPRPVMVRKPNKEVVEMAFWMGSPSGPLQIGRVIDVCPLKDTLSNYAGPVSEALSWTAAYKPEEDARMFLFHGKPGTGKTHAIRSLAWEWRRWAKFHYITDPESFFNQPAYMFHVLSAKNGVIRYEEATMSEEDCLAAEMAEELESLLDAGGGVFPTPTAVLDNGTDKLKWTVLVLEDCGELIAEDAKDRTGQGLSRLLNMVDGLLGQGMKVLVLLTTNETLDKLNEAVMRAGRCAQNLEFLPLDRREANAWLLAQKIDYAVIEPKSIADLYAIRRDEGVKTTLKIAKKGMGFA